MPNARNGPGFAGPGLDLFFAATDGECLYRLSGHCTVTETVVVTGVAPEAVPVIVSVNVAAEAFRLALTVNVEFPVGVTELGLKDTLTFRSWPDADKATGAAVPLTSATVSLSVMLFPRLTVIDVLAGVIENTGGGAGTVTVRVVVSTMVPEVPVTVMEYVPGAAPLGTGTNMAAEDCEDDREFEGEKVTGDHPDGTVAESVMVPLNPPAAAKEMLELADFPCEIVSDEGEAERLNPGAAGPERASIRPSPFGLPQPVARSYPVVAE